MTYPGDTRAVAPRISPRTATQRGAGCAGAVPRGRRSRPSPWNPRLPGPTPGACIERVFVIGCTTPVELHGCGFLRVPPDRVSHPRRTFPPVTGDGGAST